MSRRKRSPGSSDDDYKDFNKRQINHEDVQETLVTLIYELGDNDLYTLPSDLQTVASIIKKDLTILRREILDVLVNCAKNIPEKLTIYVTLIGLVNSKDYSLGEEFVELLLKHFKDAVKNGIHDDTKFILRFMSDLININVINPSSIMTLYNVLINHAMEESTTQLCSDWLLYVVMFSFPWAVGKLAGQCHSDLEKLLLKIGEHIEKRQVDHLNILQVWMTTDHQTQEDYIDCLWNQIKNMRMQGWREKVLWRLYNDPSLSILVQQSRPHKLPQLSLILSHSIYPIPCVVFRLFDYTDVIEDECELGKTETIPSLDESNNIIELSETKVLDVAMDTMETKPASRQLLLPGSHSIERFLIEQQYRIIINGFKTNRKLCAKALIALPMRVRLAVSYMIVETVLGEMFKLPKSDQSHLYYTSLLIELCREAPNSIPLVLAQATEMLFDRIETMRTICIERFVCWFSHHLSNFKFQWSWSDWAYCIQDTFDKPKTRFISEVLQRLLRFSYFEYVSKIVPAEFSRLLPKPPGAVNKYGEGAPKNLPCQKVAQKLTQMFRNHGRSDDIITLLKDIADERVITIKLEASSDDPLKEEQSPLAEVSKNGDNKEDIETVNTVEMEIENYEDDKNECMESAIVKVDYGLYPGVTRRVLDVLLTSLLNIGSKTFTHAFMYIEKYHKVIKAFVMCEQDEVEALHCLYGVWQEQRQMMVVIIDKLIEKKIIQPYSVIYWIFSDEMFSQINCFYVWEIISGILDTASLDENDSWNRLQEVEETTENELAKEEVKRCYAASRKQYMDLVLQSLAGIILRLQQGSTNVAYTVFKEKSVDLVEYLQRIAIDITSDNNTHLTVSEETRSWLLGRVENLLLTVDLPHNYVIKQVDRFMGKMSVPDQFLEIYGVFRVTVNQAA